MSTRTLKVVMLIVLYIPMIVMVIAAFDKSVQAMVPQKPINKYAVVITVTTFAVTISAIGIHGVYSGKRVFLLPFVFCHSLLAFFSLAASVHILVQPQPQIPREYAVHFIICTILDFILTSVTYFYFNNINPGMVAYVIDR